MATFVISLVAALLLVSGTTGRTIVTTTTHENLQGGSGGDFFGGIMKMFMPNADGGPGQMFAGFFNSILSQASSLFAPFMGQMSGSDPTQFINGVAQQLTQAFGQLTNLWSNTVGNQMQNWNSMGGRRNNHPDVEILTDSIERLERARSEMNSINSKIDGFTSVKAGDGSSNGEHSKLRVESYNGQQSTVAKFDPDTKVTTSTFDDATMQSLMEHFETMRRAMDEVWTQLEPRLKEITSNKTVPFLNGIDINSDSVRNVMIDAANEMNELWKMISDRISEEMANMQGGESFSGGSMSMDGRNLMDYGRIFSSNQNQDSEVRKQVKVLDTIQDQLNNVRDKFKKENVGS